MSMITAYLKPTNFCNVGCDHCYLTTEVRADKSRMSEETLRQTVRLLGDMASARRAQGIHVLWHGGEPLTMPVEWYWRAGEILDEMLPGHVESVQTSLIPFTEKWIPWVKERLKSFIGSSVDFSTRTVKGSPQAYQDLWMRKVELARGHGIYVVPTMVPSTREVHRASEIVQWFIERDFLEIAIERYNSFGQPLPDCPTNAEHSEFLIGLFSDAMTRIAMGREKIPMFRAVTAAIGGVLHDSPGDRWGGSCQSDFIVIEPDGSTNNCTDKTSFEKPYSNVAGGFAEFAASPLRRKWIRIQTIDHRKDHCMTCENRSWCGSGCPLTPNGPSEGQEECAGYKRFIDFIRDFIRIPAQEQMVRDYYDYCVGRRAMMRGVGGSSLGNLACPTH